MKNNIQFVINTNAAAQKAGKLAQAALADMPPLDIPLVVAVGGDGTMLHAIREHIHQDVVLVGISAGHLGFLQTIETEQIDLLVKALKQKTYDLIEAPLLSASYCRPTNDNAQDDKLEKFLGHAFNDISIERHGSRAAKFDLLIDTSSGSFIGDGVIFSTPLGSTAYSLAAGGPVVDSEAQDLFVTTPNNPHVSTLYSSLQRPHVLNKHRHVRIEVDPAEADERPTQLVIDGHVTIPVLRRPISIYLSRHNIKLLQLEYDSFHNRIESKRLGRS